MVSYYEAKLRSFRIAEFELAHTECVYTAAVAGGI